MKDERMFTQWQWEEKFQREQHWERHEAPTLWGVQNLPAASRPRRIKVCVASFPGENLSSSPRSILAVQDPQNHWNYCLPPRLLPQSLLFIKSNSL